MRSKCKILAPWIYISKYNVEQIFKKTFHTQHTFLEKKYKSKLMSNEGTRRSNKILAQLSPLENCSSLKIILGYYGPKIIWQRHLYLEYSIIEQLPFG